MGTVSEQLELSLVERHYDADSQEWTVNLKSSDYQPAKTVTIKNPIDKDEEEQIRWYVEDYALKDPYRIGRAQEAMALLEGYGNELAQILQPAIRDMISPTSEVNINIRTIRLEVVSQSSTSKLQQLHWELLEFADWDFDAKINFVVTRRIDTSGKDSFRKEIGSEQKFHILFISARPNVEEDIDYRLISRHLVDLTHSPPLKGHCTIDFVRPGSWLFVNNHLQSHPPGYYSIVHFDVHGSIYENQPHLHFSPVIPELLFDVQEASTIAEQLKAAKVGMVILNACNSANAQHTHSNLAEIFVQAGIGTVIAMSYSVLAESAKIFIGKFYDSFLVEHLDADLAAHAARRAIETNCLRRGDFGLVRSVRDGLIPVIYKGYSGSVSWKAHSILESTKPEELNDLQLPLDVTPFIGRDIDILQLENLLFWKRAVFLYGPAASGKTTLAHHLKDWWVRTGYFENAIIISCDSFSSFDESTIFRTLASLIGGEPDLDAGPSDEYMIRQKVLQSSSIIIIDNCETTAGTINLEHFELPVMSQQETEDLFRFVENVCTEPEAKCRLMLFSRTNAILAQFMLGPDTGIENEDIGYYELKNLRAAEAVQIMTGGIRTLRDTENKQASDLIAFHDNNATMASILGSCIGNPNADITYLDETLQTELPHCISESLTGRLQSTPTQNVSVFSIFVRVMKRLRTTYPNIHRAMLCLALNRERSLDYSNLSSYFLNVAGWGLLPACPAAQASKLSWPSARRAGRDPERFHQEIFDHCPSTRYAFRDAIKILKVIGLMEDDIEIPSGHYDKLHPLLPYLLRLEMQRLEDSAEFSQRLRGSFLEYWHFRASEWTKAGPETIPGLIFTEWPNLCCAIELCVKEENFGKASTEVLSLLTHVLKESSPEPKRIEMASNLLIKAVSRFEGIATASPHSALDLDTLEKAMAIVRTLLELLRQKHSYEIDEASTAAIKQSRGLLESSISVYGEPEAVKLTGFMLHLAILRYELTRDESDTQALFKSVWNSVLPDDDDDVEDESAAPLETILFCHTKFDLIFLLMDRPHLAESCAVTKDMIRERAESFLSEMKSENLDTTILELRWSMFQLKHWSDHDIPFDLDGTMQAEEMLEMIEQRGFQLDGSDESDESQESQETNTWVALLLSIKYKYDYERASNILRHALHGALQRDDREEQRLLHRALFSLSSEQHDLEHSVLHFNELITIDHALAPGQSPSNVLSRGQYHFEAMGNIIIANIVIRRRTRQYLSVPGNATPGTSRPPIQAIEEDKRSVESRLSRALQLAVDNDFPDLQCRAHLALGAYEAYLNARPRAGWGHFARAVSLGDKVTSKFKEQFVLGTDLAHGKFMANLMIAWQFKTATAARDDISNHIAAALGDSWTAIQVRSFLDLTYNSLEIVPGVRVNYTCFQKPPLDRYFEEAQKILFDDVRNSEIYIFWIQNDSGWVINQEATSEAVMHALWGP